MIVVDRPDMTDGFVASIETTIVPPQFPCPECGKESLPHGEVARYDESQRICSAEICRKVQPAPIEVVSAGDPRFPCAECGKETKVFQSGKCALVPVDRICSDPNCRKVFCP